LEFFFEATARRRQISGVHQRDGSRLQPLAAEQSSQQVLIDTAQATDAYLLAKLVQHAHGGMDAAQPGKASPGWLFG
jgi:hypothetical protein